MEHTSLKSLSDWVKNVAEQTKPERVHWCNGSKEEYDDLVGQMVKSKEFTPLNSATYPECYLYRSDPNDVARTEHLTFICSKNKDDAGPLNNWMAPSVAKQKANEILAGCMKGRTMYVIPYVMGPVDSPLSRCGVQITDSSYVAINMSIMTRSGKRALQRIEREEKFVKGLHSLVDLNPNRRFVMHFPEELAIISLGSGYGGNALLGKKCHALRIASPQAKNEGWLAEHMLIIGIETPSKETFYVTGAFPSGCGKTNLAMMLPPKEFNGYRIWTLGDDIAWLHLREDGRLWAINPEAGFFGIAPGTSAKSNLSALEMSKKNTIFTNVGLTNEKEPWWEGLSKEPPAGVIDWQGRPYDPKNGPVAHPNSRFTVPLPNCPSYSSLAEDPKGVPISAILFGGRRRSLAPLVVESNSWEHGVWLGATSGSETTAAMVGQVGVPRYDPMAMRPFCGYNMADYWNHWLSFSNKSSKLPKIFRVNWFRQDAQGRYLWPGYGENIRVLKWVIDRCTNKASAEATPIGLLPKPSDINIDGLDINPDTMKNLLSYNNQEWLKELDEIDKFIAPFEARIPKGIQSEQMRIRKALKT